MQNGTTSGIEPLTSSNTKESLKDQFLTREGLYRKMTISDQLSRPHRLTTTQGNTNPTASSYNAPVRVSFVRLPICAETSSTQLDENGELQPIEEPRPLERICFNIGRELFVYDFNSAKGTFDWTKPIDKRIYKGTFPTSHDFNLITLSPHSCMLLVGFSAGQIQLIDPFQKEFQNSRLYNEDRLVDKSPVTCLKWVPNEAQLFIASHSSGQMYVYNEEFSCAPNPPTYQLLKQGEGYSVYNVKSRSQQKNPIQRWTVGRGAVNQFEFGGANSAFMATVSQDGFLRIFKYKTMELYAVMRSYFGGLLCLAWSPDHKLIATGGEDDLLTVYSVQEKRVLCRGAGHKSFITHVAFDPYTSGNPVILSSTHAHLNSMNVGSVSSTEELRPIGNGPTSSNSLKYSNGTTENKPTFNGKQPSLAERWQQSLFEDSRSRLNSFEQNSIVYRIGTVGADTQLCLWDVTDELLGPGFISNGVGTSGSSTNQNHAGTSLAENHTIPETTSTTKDGTVKESKTSKLKKLHKRGLSFGNRHGNQDRWSRANIPLNRSAQNQANNLAHSEDGNPDRAINLFGTPQCPKMDQIPLLEPLICKKISHERLTSLCFREDCLITACNEGFIARWQRPNRMSRF